MVFRGVIAALALAGLTACEQVSGQLVDGLSRIGAVQDATGEGIKTLALMNGAVRVRGPEGYCVDQAASAASSGFAVMAGCALLSDEAAIMPRPDGLITVQFGPEGTASITGNEDAFATFLETEAGRTVLSQTSDAATVEEVFTLADRAGVLVRFEDTSGPAFPGTSGPQWRGFLDLDGRLTTITVLSFDRNPLSRAEGERLLVVAMAELAEVNAQANGDTADEET